MVRRGEWVSVVRGIETWLAVLAQSWLKSGEVLKSSADDS